MSYIVNRAATGPLALQASGTFQTSTDTNLNTLLGTRWDTSDGRELALGMASSATTVAEGKLYQNAALISNHQNLDVTAVQAYSNNGNTPATVTATLGGTAVTANQYQGGYVAVVDGAGEGQVLKIASHPAQSNGSGSLTITLEDGPSTALSASTSEISLLPPTGKNLIIHPTTPTNTAFGLAMYPIAASSYGFFLVNGVGCALCDAVVAGPGVEIGWSALVAGAVAGTPYAANELTGAALGQMAILGVSGEYRPVKMNM